MTTNNVPPPFPGPEAQRIAEALRRAVAGLPPRATVTHVQEALRNDPQLSNEDYMAFARTLLQPREGWELEAYICALIDHGSGQHG